MIKKKTTDAVKILHNRYVKNNPEMEELLEEERLHAEVAVQNPAFSTLRLIHT